MATESYLDGAKREFRRLRQLAESAIAQLDDTQYFEKPGDEDNSVAVIVKHLGGSMRSRWDDFLGSAGERARDRDAEFVISSSDTRDSIQQTWMEGWEYLVNAVDTLEESDLDKTVKIRGEPHTVLQAINRQLTHSAYHVGQLVFLSKHLVGTRWRTLSIPKGQSAASGQRRGAYLTGRSVGEQRA